MTIVSIICIIIVICLFLGFILPAMFDCFFELFVLFINGQIKFHFGGIKKVMRLFNSFQIVSGFVAIPFGIAWLQDQTFMGQVPAFYASCALYVVAFGCMVGSVYSSLGKFKD